MDVQLSAEQNKLIRSIASEEGFGEYKVETKTGSAKGDGYSCAITRVIIKNGKQLDLILKLSSKDEKLREAFPVNKIFSREIFLYKTVLPEFRRFQEENDVPNAFSGFAKLYASSETENEECLFLQDLTAKGCKMWDRKISMNPQHISSVFTEYAKFHAISLAMKHKQPESFRKLSENLEDIARKCESSKVITKFTMQSGLKAVESSVVATEAMMRFSNQAEKFFYEDLSHPDDHFVVIHGDSWCNNLMFKYQDPGDCEKPSKVYLLDWQMSMMGSPILDLSYFFYVCSPMEIIYEYEKYLKIYHDAVSEQLRLMSCDVEELLPFNVLKRHWKFYSKYGLYFAIMVVKLMVSDSEETPDTEGILENGNFFYFRAQTLWRLQTKDYRPRSIYGRTRYDLNR